ncbi:helix-turn-helix domain-containing protein [Streptomyces sp. NPDC020719]|uniref:helix-turn-helix domain-containing protein n=1 Tax=Streptomyces sp. NPDC020719 TaxID=3154896 RepID=UPI0033CB00FA
MLIAQEIAALSECRPGVAYLSRKLKVSERTVQYHLDMLREAGLLVYRTKGTRISGAVNLASVFERVIPVEFDVALGVRTKLVGEDAKLFERRPVGIAEASRRLMGRLARKAARKVRRRRSKPQSRCTPMQGASSGSSPAATPLSPSESKLADGKKGCPTPKQQKRGRQLNRVGRRYQLARELIGAVPWLGRAATGRIAWIVRHVADAGWSYLQVQAFLALGGAPTQARRPSGLLAHRLKGAHELWDTADKRRRGTEAWQDLMLSRRETAVGRCTPAMEGPARVGVQRIMAEALQRMRQLVANESALPVLTGAEAERLEHLSRDQVLDMRAAAQKDPALIHSMIEVASEADARRLYTNQLVDQALTRYSPGTLLTW